ncbi:hypothetical protein HZS_7461, partial [Henneguya salminicola]
TVTTHFSDQVLGIEKYELEDVNKMLKTIVDFAKSGVENFWVTSSDSLSEDIELSFSADCGNGEFENDVARCSSVDPDRTIRFKIHIKIKKCMENLLETSVVFNGRQDFPIHISSQCECDCEKHDKIDENSATCNKAGDLVCGGCVCHITHEGDKCQCQKNDDISTSKCTSEGVVCSSRGNCVCEQCKCNQKPFYYGKFCECNDLNCPSIENRLCNGKGKCVCGKCQCVLEFIGDDCSKINCELPTLIAKCKGPEGSSSNEICNSHGICNCGICKCSPEYQGAFCQLLTNPKLSCIDFKMCVEEDYLRK